MSGNDQVRWHRIDGIFEAALELPAEDRNAFLERTCGIDTELRREIDSLLAHERADGFLDAPVSIEASQLLGE